MRLTGHVLGPLAETRTIRLREGDLTVDERPVSEQTLQIAGFNIFGCADADCTGQPSGRLLWEDRRMTGSNIGVAVYAIGETAGTLDARWSYENAYSGAGQATGGPKEGFVGDFHIQYFFENGDFSDEYDLQIRKTGDLYDLAWLVDGAVSAIGVGMEVGSRLAVGWRRVTG